MQASATLAGQEAWSLSGCPCFPNLHPDPHRAGFSPSVRGYPFSRLELIPFCPQTRSLPATDTPHLPIFLLQGGREARESGSELPTHLCSPRQPWGLTPAWSQLCV